ncbi:unnamed protein product [Plutella xylostella]|uniref:(diamondback moth) hypothetical protein n=1 Tax=Plutella xylostella TaxID=51655 RepID=A0A8S4EUI5_PLUXY|nr:unnamed protein product [Plutella xylostella]
MEVINGDEEHDLGEGDTDMLATEGESVHEEFLEEEGGGEGESVLSEYDDEDFVSGAVTSVDSSMPYDLFEFEYPLRSGLIFSSREFGLRGETSLADDRIDNISYIGIRFLVFICIKDLQYSHSFGYDCRKVLNLCAADAGVVCWAAGSLVSFLDVATGQAWSRRTSTGGSVGYIASYRKDPHYRLAVAEGREGRREPLILLYTWPQMEIDAVLRDGTANAYAALDFSPNGELLASVGKEPDYNITIWNWRRHKILLRTSAFTFDVNTVVFSPYCPGQLTTAGAGHIKFWKMVHTFTGLKLQGDLGRFGKTEICDVLGVYPMPDEKVQFMLSGAGDEVTTVARDGCVRAWYWDSVEQADPPEDDPFVELNPVAETCDGNGGIWTVELELDNIHCEHRKVMTSHAGAVVAMATLRTHPLLLTAGVDGCLHAYNTDTNALVVKYTFPTAITCLLYPTVDERVILLCGQEGLVMEAVLPDVPLKEYDEITTFKQEFDSYKEVIIKKHILQRRPFPTEEDLASLDEEALKARDEAEREDDDDEEWIGPIELLESEDKHGPTVTWAEYCSEGVWVVQRGTGALLLVRPGSPDIHKYAPIPDSWADDLTTLRFVCEKKYLLLGTNNGYIRMLRMPTKEEDNPKFHYESWVASKQKLMKKLKGRRLAKEEVGNQGITKLFTCGRDGNIFSYTVNFPMPLVEVKEYPRFESITAKKAQEPSTVDGEMMSHEELKQKEEYDKMMAIANAHKKKMRDTLSQLSLEYNKIIKANRLLPVSQQIDLTLDPRPLKAQEDELDEAKALTIRKLAHQLEASNIGLNKMHSRYIIMLDVFPFALTAIRDPSIILRPLRQKNLSKDFEDQLAEVHQKMAEAALRGRRADVLTRKPMARRPSWAAPRAASFLLGLPPKPPHPLKKAIRNYYQRLHRHHMQFMEWQEHLSRKPDPNALPPGAEEALREAEATIGNRVLKTQPDYVAPPGHNTQLRLCLTRKEVYETKRSFNEKVLELREAKVKLVSKMKKIGERLLEIRAEIPSKLVKQPPPVPSIDYELEFPEKNLKVNPEPIIVPMGARSKPSMDRRKSLFPQARIKEPRVPKFVTLMESKPLAATWEMLRPRTDAEFSDVEIEVRERRIKRHLYEQDMLIADAEAAVTEFDARLVQLQRERIRVQEKNELQQLHLYQLHQEMNVLNRFEAHEDRLAERVYGKLMQVRAVQEQIADCEQRIDEHADERERLEAECEEIHHQFKKLVQESKFADFLRRIFKKKYRPPRDLDDDDTSESESSSSSSDEDSGSLDSYDIGPIRLDPTVCPEGCEQEIYDQTYDMRNSRHKREQEIIENDRLVELLKKDIEAHEKVKKKLSVQLEERKNELKEFMLEKQNCLNQVSTVVVLRYDQIRARALADCGGPEGLSRAVVFPQRVLKQLRTRVLELQQEILLQKERQKINRTHLHRMNIDLRVMDETAKDLRAQMKDVLTKKLGKPRKVDKTLDDLLKQMARRHKYMATMDFVPQLLQQIRDWKKRYSEQEKLYFKCLEESAERLRLAAAIQADVMPNKPLSSASVGAYSPEQYRCDVVRLRIVRAQQQHHIQVSKQ